MWIFPVAPAPATADADTDTFGGTDGLREGRGYVVVFVFYSGPVWGLGMGVYVHVPLPRCKACKGHEVGRHDNREKECEIRNF